MAVSFDKSNIKRGATEWKAWPEELVLIPGLNGRHDQPDLEPMIESIVTFGQLEPVLIRREDGKPVVTDGFTRVMAIAEINKRNLLPNPIEVRCSVSLMNEQQAFLAAIHANFVHNGMKSEKLSKLLATLGACKEARTWAKGKTPETAWGECNNGDWILWLLDKINYTCTAPAWAEYKRVADSAWAEYERVTAPALDEYKRVMAPASAEYKRVMDSALDEYKRVTASTIRSLVPLSDVVKAIAEWRTTA